MANLDIQLDAPPLPRRRADEYRLVQQARPRGLIGQMTTLLLQPKFFFQTLPAVHAGHQWLAVAVLILALAGFTAVRQSEMAAGGGAAPVPADMGGMADPMAGPRMGGGSIDMGIPPDLGMPIEGPGMGGAPAGGNASVSATWTTALMAGGVFVSAWLVQALLLSEVSLFNGRAPKPGLNLQIAVYASLPLALMAALQLIFYAAGGELGQPGLLGLVVEWSGYQQAGPFVQLLLLSLASRLTLFWLWSLALLYVGARGALKGRWWASLLVVLVWATILVVTPVVTGAIAAPTAETSIEPLHEDVMPDVENEEPLPGGIHMPTDPLADGPMAG